MKYFTSIVPLKGVPEIWPKVAPMLQKSTTVTNLVRVDIADLLEQCITGQSTLWIVFSEDKEIVSAFTSQIIEYPQYKALSIQYLGGAKMNEWLSSAMSVTKSFAMASGCATMEGYGREGWGRALRKFGWGKAYTAFEVDLSDQAMAQAAE